MDKKVIYGAVLGLGLIASVLFYENFQRKHKKIPPDTSISENRKNLPNDLKMERFPDKSPIRFSDYKGKVLLVNFWASWCEACMAEMPSIQKLYNSLKGEGLEVLGINVDDNPQSVVPDIVDKLNLRFTMATEVDGQLTSYFNVVAIPFSIVIGRDQKVVWAESGERDWSSDMILSKMKGLLK
ncbi:MAG: TlpA disulfide reductase family protein [Bacteriovoracia bacterium]